MFYSQLVLAKKGPLGRVWLAAHWDRKLTKTQINGTDIAKSVDSIMRPEVPFALRMSGHLLLGVVRIYSRKVKYLLSDCTDALLKIKMAFRPGMVDLPADANVAAINSITLPEHAGDIDMNIAFEDDTLMPCGDELFTLNTVLRDTITLARQPSGIPSKTIDEDDILATGGAEVEDSDDEVFGTKSTPAKVATPEAPRDNIGTPMQQTDERGFETPTTGGEHFNIYEGETDFPMPDIELSTPHGVSVPVTPISAIKLVEPSDFELHVRPSVEATPDTPGTPGTPGTPITVVPPTGTHKRDRQTELTSKYIKEQLKNTGPITRDMVLAPVTKKALLQRERERDVGTLYRITSIDGLGSELLDLFALSMVDGPRQAVEVDILREEEERSPPHVTPFKSPAVEEFPGEEFTGDVGFGDNGFEDIGEKEQDSAVPQTPLDESFSEIGGGEIDGEVPAPVDVSPDKDKEPMSERTKKMHAYLNKTFGEEATTISYLDLVKGKKTHTVAGTFFELLVLKSRNLIELEQDEPYTDIRIKKTDHFYDTQEA